MTGTASKVVGNRSVDATLLASLGFHALQSGCKDALEDITKPFVMPSVDTCAETCSTTPGCDTFALSNPRVFGADMIPSSKCVLKRRCSGGLRGECSNNSAWCVFTHGQSFQNVKEWFNQSLVQMRSRARVILERQRSNTHRGGVCTSPTLFSPRKPRRLTFKVLDKHLSRAVLERANRGGIVGTMLSGTIGKSWRYYSAFECGSPPLTKICLLFKAGGGVIVGARSFFGRTFSNSSRLVDFGWNHTEQLLTHNLALLCLPGNRWVMMGGLQGFASNETCRKLQRGRLARLRIAGSTRNQCLSVVPATSPQAMAGIRFSQGRGSEFGELKWDEPRLVIHGTMPSGCIDRRSSYTGYPHLQACEFDGRLSLVHHHGRFRMYARANLRFHAVVGGRFVQTTHSNKLESGWQRWEPSACLGLKSNQIQRVSYTSIHPVIVSHVLTVRLLGVEAERVDLYFFAAQSNPVDNGSLLALFPVNQPPQACVALAFSIDGVRWSRPMTLKDSPSSFRSSNRGGGGRVEFRGEDHPVAGVVRSPGDPDVIHFYIHHSVKGLATRKGSIPHVALYRVPAALLFNLTSHGLEELARNLDDTTLDRAVAV